MHSTRIVVAGWLLLALGCVRPPPQIRAEVLRGPVDLLIRGGTVVDGSGREAFAADVAVTDDRIVFIGDAARAGVAARDTIDAAGLVVAPGFIDAHTGTSYQQLSDPTATGRANLAALFQGVTTVFGAKDGFFRGEVGTTLAAWEKAGIGTNGALFAPLCSFRAQVMRGAGRATAVELDSIKELVAKAMNEGAFGLSSGLYYAPCSFFTTEEVIVVAKVAAEKGGIYDSHIRDEGTFSVGLLAAVDEAIRIGREADMPVIISHIKALGPEVWGQSAQVVARISQARKDGFRVWATHYPYEASGTSLVDALVPRTADFVGWRDRLQDPESRRRLIDALGEGIRRRGGAEAILVATSTRAEWAGERLATVASRMGRSPAEAALTLIEMSARGNENIVSFNMSQADVDRFAVQDFVMTATDGGDEHHPRTYGSFAKKVRDYVNERGLLTLPFVLRSSSGLTAEVYGLRDRGLVKTGSFADIIVFDARAVRDKATYSQPNLPAEGMRHVFVNGVAAIKNGRYTGALAGRALRQTTSGR